MKPAAKLKKMFRGGSFTEDRETVVYFRASTRYARQLFALKLLDHDNVRRYDGSWREWPITWKEVSQ